MRNFVILSVMASLVFVAGCSSKVKCESCQINAGSEQYLCAARSVLEKYDFKIDKFDLEKGYLRTQPLSGGQFVQFWRKDNQGAFNTAEANMHSIVRTVEVLACPGSPADQFQLTVNTKRLSLVGEEVVSIADARKKFTNSSSGNQRLAIDMDTDNACWIDLGRDCKLEKKLQQVICKELSCVSK